MVFKHSSGIHCAVLVLVLLNFCNKLEAGPVKSRQRRDESEGPLIKIQLNDESHRWPQGKIPYAVDDDIDGSVSTAIKEAINEFSGQTCVHFVPRKDEENYIHFISSSRCHTTIGRVGGRQEVEMGPECGDKGTALHELMHVLGYGHEHNRPDRDEYVDIIWDNIKSGETSNFIQDAFEWNMDIPYDYGSILHYAKDAFSVKPGELYTIEPKNDVNGVQLGQRKQLSKRDVQKIRKFYMCDGKKSLAPDVQPSCIYRDEKYLDGEEFDENDYVMKCFAYLNGTRIVRPIACLDRVGQRRNQGQRWSSDGFIMECRVDYNPDSGDMSAGQVPVQCIASNTGNPVDPGETWLVRSGDGPFSFVSQCKVTEGNGLLAVPVRCRYDGPAGSIDIEVGCYKRRQSLYVSCIQFDPSSLQFSGLASNSPPPPNVKLCDNENN